MTENPSVDPGSWVGKGDEPEGNEVKTTLDPAVESQCVTEPVIAFEGIQAKRVAPGRGRRSILEEPSKPSPPAVVYSAVIWVNMYEDVELYVIRGDWREYEGMYINGGQNDVAERVLCEYMYDEEGAFRFQSVSVERWQKAVINGALVVRMGFYS